MKAHLNITTYSGTCPGASHWMGRLHIEGVKDAIDLEYEMTTAQAKRFNKEEYENNGSCFGWKKGATTTRFFTEAELIEASIELALKHGVTLLFQGSHCVLDPQPVLIGPEPLKTELNALVAEAEACGWYEGDEKKMDGIFKRWRIALGLKP